MNEWKRTCGRPVARFVFAGVVRFTLHTVPAASSAGVGGANTLGLSQPTIFVPHRGFSFRSLRDIACCHIDILKWSNNWMSNSKLKRVKSQVIRNWSVLENFFYIWILKWIWNRSSCVLINNWISTGTGLHVRDLHMRFQLVSNRWEEMACVVSYNNKSFI